ncbi:MAG: MFS transporter [Candidatus Buchananbacteria bacterium]|nr:MFS transporter [Candidatus Buchananbacteria bacterium]
MPNFFKSLYLKTRLSSGVTALYSNIVIDEIGSGLVGLFLPIFLWEKFGRLDFVLIYFLVIYVIYAVTVIFGAMLMSKLGQKASMIISVPFKVLFYLCLYYLSLGYPINIFVVLMIIMIEIQMMMFWVPYHTDFARFTNKKDRGRVIGFLSSVSSLVSIFVPIISGWIIYNYDFDVLFLIVIILVAISAVPLFMVAPTYEKFSFSFRETWRQFFAKKHRRMLLSFFSTGVENMIGGIIWPIFIFQLLQGDFLKVGIISSVIVLSTIIIRLIVGSYTDKFDKHKLLKWGSGLYAVGWMLKTFVATGFQIFVVSTYHNFASIIMQTPYSAITYEKAADSGHYVDEITVLKEMALNLGRVAGALILLVMISFVGLHWTFVLAAIASLFINII